MRRGKDASLKALISAMAEAESKSYYEEQENALNDLSGLLKTFLTGRFARACQDQGKIMKRARL